MLPLDPPLPSSYSGINDNNNASSKKSWDSGATPSVCLALRAEALVLSSCRLWCPPRPWSLIGGEASGGGGGSMGRGRKCFIHRVSAHALACPANHVSGVRLLAALLPPESPAPLHRLKLPVATAAAAAAGVAAAAAADAAAGGGGGGTDHGSGTGGASLRHLVGRVHTAAALERSEGLRRQAVATLERSVGEVLKGWDVCVAGDLFPSKKGAGDGGEVGSEEGGGEAEGKDKDGEKGNCDGDDGEGDEEMDGGGWRPALAANPVLAVTAPGVVNVPAVVVSLCHSASPVLHRRVLQLARR